MIEGICASYSCYLGYLLDIYNEMESFQKRVLFKLFNEFEKHSESNPIVEFENGTNEDGDILLYRRTDNALINIIISTEDYIACSIISKEEDKRILNFYKEEDSLEELAISFLKT